MTTADIDHLRTQMPFQVRSSKFRHVFGRAHRKEQCYENIKITRNAHDSNFCAVNPKFIAVVVESSGGGSFLCIPLHQTGRVDVNAPRISGHAGKVLDIKWSPFSDYMIASCSDDNTVKVWQLPENGLKGNLTEWVVDLHGHSRRATYIDWHPTAENVLLSAGMDFKCILWNIEQAEPINIIDCHKDTVFSMSWNREGSLFASTCKDRNLRIIDPRISSVAMETQGHVGNKASKVAFVSSQNKLITTGFDRMSTRQLALWDVKNLRKPINMIEMDSSSGVVLPFYDYDSKVVYTAGKGDGNIRYFEITDDSEGIHYLNQFQSPFPQRGFGVMPKRGCDTSKCEVMRFYKLLAAKDIIEPISMIVPRKSDKFHDDIYPPTPSMIPSLSADEWISGQNREPILMSLLDGSVTNSPKCTSANAVQKQDGSLAQTPTITTYKALSPPQLDRPVPFPTTAPGQMGKQTGQPRQQRTEPASLKNIKRLSSNEDYITLSDQSLDRRVKPLDLDKSHSTEQSQVSRTAVKKTWTPTSPAGNDPPTNGFTGPDNNSDMSTNSSKQDWGPNINSSSNHSNHNCPPLMKHLNNKPSPSTQSVDLLLGYKPQLPEDQHHLRKAYFSQMEEIKSLKEQITLKDKRIRLLEEEIATMKKPRCGPGESDC
ncbi:coronin-2B-like isoform X3 [Mizuhopecten yessoensis]|uniref:coronin-2B-like isoform X3 n=1 Tax=Mizuhopecten yessoensis TaxID=6573 RepID=UPI000B45F47B|nr:coronin-2B-like isoform X3 [Mizuhopecten yessoensis]